MPGTRLRPRVSLSWMRPPRTTVWPVSTLTRLVILRCWIVGVSVGSPSATRLPSWPISSATTWLALIRGRTCRMTPVSRYSTLLTSGASGFSMLCERRVSIGT